MEWTALIPPFLLLIFKLISMFLDDKEDESAYGKTIRARKEKLDEAIVRGDIGDLNRRFEDVSMRLRKANILRSCAQRQGYNPADG